ncbi:MAG TPA: GNAT family N-acetyltransferase [Spirochaetota bacterium]|nr:GNAT family N-acetyltransferase [Spirochaetota bacterium]OPZ36625.1 MAG: Acetyltransferase Pat [Spirochaetes bacterium ADurb.BinA120]HNU92535.1 GNAT family N-acetyltransferase [Spirochaetota bacterium]HPI14911.1 GNAT family N-acetyltransferase [Spirochaetota bacterium]HPV98766.1 GNAT family N-acetyltransferase [Spirochaetota bacterium]
MKKNDDYGGKLVSIDRILGLIKPGNRVFLSSGPSIPALTVRAIVESDRKNLLDLEIIQLITLGSYLPSDARQTFKYRLKTFNIGESIVHDINEGKVDFIPANLMEIPVILSSGAVGVDIAIVQTSPPDKRGFLNLGVAVDVANIAIKNADLVVAEINPAVPVTYGETSIHMNQVDYMVHSSVPLLERERAPYDPEMERIGWHISNIIEDESTVVLHVGRMFDAIAKNLHSKKRLGVYTHVISDWVIDLVESGAVSLDRSRVSGGLITTSYCYGTRELYDYVDRNPVIEFYPIARLVNPFVTQRISRLISIMNVKRIDVTGESVVFHSGDNLLSGYESKLNFAIAAAFSKQGKAIVALRSIDQEGNSNIVIAHEEGERVRATLGATRYVVTEFGVARLFGRSIRERVLAMIDIAHPSHREGLLGMAKKYGYTYPDQIYACNTSCKYPSEIDTVKTFGPGLELKIRPILPSDEDMMRRLFYEFSDESKYLRYFARLSIMPHQEMQKYVNIDYDTAFSIVGLLQKDRTERIIAEARYAYYDLIDAYEMAFIVDEEFQGRGIATFMLNFLIKIAKERGIKRLAATVLPQNDKMLRVFEKGEVKPKSVFADGVLELRFEL